MALTVSSTGRSPNIRVSDITCDSSYPTGGWPVTAASLGLTRLDYLHALPASGVLFHFNPASAKLQAFAESIPAGEYSYVPGGGDVKGATNVTAVMGTADQAADVVNPGTWVAYQTYTTVNGAGGSLGAITLQPPFARNVVVSIKNASAGALSLFTGANTFTVTGTYRGVAQTEAITLTLTGGQVSVVNAKFRAVAGVKPFDTITSVAVDATSLAGVIANAAGALQIGVGPGTKFGFPVPPATGADADVVEFSVNAAARAIATNSDYTNQTFNTGTLADGDDVSIVYATAGVTGGTKFGNAYAHPEVPNGTDLSAVSTRVVAFGDTVYG